MIKLFCLIAFLTILIISGCGTNTAAPIQISDSPTAAELSKAPPTKLLNSKIDDIEIASKALMKNMRFDVYLPPGYDAGTKYPVLYVLYGYGGNRGYIFSAMGLNQVADRLIQEDKISPMIIVSPDYGNSFGVNTIPGQGVNSGNADEGNYEDYLLKEVMPYVDTHYSTKATRDSRYVGGFSMGGYAALFLGFSHADLFSKIGGHSAAIWDYTSHDNYTDQRDWLYPNEALRNQRDPFRLAVSNNLKNVQVYLDAGNTDGLAVVDEKLYVLLKNNNIPAEWHTSPGGHSTTYWTAHFEDYLVFYSGK